MSWGDLPKEITFKIFKKFAHNIYDLPDLYQCLFVCHLWRIVAKELLQCSEIVRRDPWVVIPWAEPNNIVVFNTSLCSSRRNTCLAINGTSSDDTDDDDMIVFSLPKQLLLLHNDKKVITYASYGGWLLLGLKELVEYRHYSRSNIDEPMFLYNPMLRVVFQLPTLPSTVRLDEDTQFVMSETSPADPKCIICVRNSSHSLAFVKAAGGSSASPSSSSSWVLSKKPEFSGFYIESMIFYGKDFYTLDDDAALFVHHGIKDLILDDSNVITTWPWPVKKNRVALTPYDNVRCKLPRSIYLAESKSGYLLMVERTFGLELELTQSFSVYKLTLRGNFKKKNWGSDNNNYDYYWKETNSLGENEALVVGGHQDSVSMSASAVDVNNNNNEHENNTTNTAYKPNCIYFFDRLPTGVGQFWRYGMYDLESRSIHHWDDFDIDSGSDDDFDGYDQKYDAHPCLFIPSCP